MNRGGAQGVNRLEGFFEALDFNHGGDVISQRGGLTGCAALGKAGLNGAECRV